MFAGYLWGRLLEQLEAVPTGFYILGLGFSAQKA